MHVSSVEPKILAATPQAAVSEGLTAPADEEKGRKGGRQIDNENEEVGAMKKKKEERGGREKKEKGHANKKKGSSASGAMARTSSRGTLHFTRPWDPHQPVSSGFTAMTLW